MNEILKVAIEAVRDASKICRSIQAQLVDEDTLTKRDRSPVTIADFASQAIICSILKSKFPELPVVGEEDTNSLRLDENRALLEKIGTFFPYWNRESILDSIDHGNGEPKDVFWTLDPIDGTKGFLRGEQYAVALALIKNGNPEVGVLGCPNLPFENVKQGGTIMYAFKDKGTFATGIDQNDIIKARVSENATSELTRFLESVESAHANHGLQGQIMEELGDKAQAVRYDSQVKYAVLARGGAEVYLRLPNPAKPDYREKIWDHAAGALIVTEAGGCVTDMFGSDLNFGLGKQLTNNRGLIVSNRRVHDDILKLIEKYSN